MRLVVAGGGTGGHVSPAVAIIEELHKRDPRLELRWVGRRKGIERRVCDGMSVPFRGISVAPWPRTRSLRRAWAFCKLGLGAVKSFIYLKRFQPQVVLGMGGYVAVPVVWAAQRLGIPTVLHEQNKRLGMANRFLAGRASRILLSYPDTLGEFPRDKSRVVGNPVRAGFLKPPDKASACETFQLDPSIPVLLVSGGSQGAQTLNRAVAESLQHFSRDEIQVIWAAGRRGVAAARAATKRSGLTVRMLAYIDNMHEGFAAADVVLTRAGASSTAELAVMGKPSILVPYPFAADDHQAENARAFEESGAAIVLNDSACTADRLRKEIRSLMADGTRRQSMGEAARRLARPVAVEAIAEEILSLAFEQSD